MIDMMTADEYVGLLLWNTLGSGQELVLAYLRRVGILHLSGDTTGETVKCPPTFFWGDRPLPQEVPQCEPTPEQSLSAEA
jgi:hypothetical protein